MKLNDSDKKQRFNFKVEYYQAQDNRRTAQIVAVCGWTAAYNNEHARRQVLDDLHRSGYMASSLSVVEAEE